MYVLYVPYCMCCPGFLIGTYSSTNAGSTPTYSVGEPTKGTPPVNGNFRIRFNTVGCTTCLVRLDLTSGPIRHDAAACNATNSVKTILEQMGNIGEVRVVVCVPMVDPTLFLFGSPVGLAGRRGPPPSLHPFVFEYMTAGFLGYEIP
jgi:hypothetical protein